MKTFGFPALMAGLFLVSVPPAQALERSLRPQARPAAQDLSGSVERILLAAARVSAPQVSLRPEIRPRRVAVSPTAPEASPEAQAGLEAWVRSFRPRALAQGISAGTFDRAFQGVRYDAKAIERDRSQAEFNTAIWQYLDSAASESRIATGREMLARHAALLDRIEARYGVEKEVVVAIWGMESAYGARRGTHPLIGAMATLAHDGRRRGFFEEQLVAALRILQNGDVTPGAMTGSWAGAMGHTQFIPTSYEALAVDFTGDGRRDIWSDDPTDALASTANYLAKSGWKKGMPWAVEVRLPRGFDYALSGKATRKMPSDWARLGVTGLDGRAVRDYGAASVFLPAGANGPAFLTFSNFRAIARYNAADAYVMGVGHLSDRLRGKGPISGAWPREDRALSRDERKELQQRLTAAGYDTGGVDGRIGPNSVSALRAWQSARGLIPDGYASYAVLRKLR